MLGKAIKALPVKSAILDGEIIAIDSSGHASFQKLQQSIKSGDAGFLFQVFDEHVHAGASVKERLEFLEAMLDDAFTGLNVPVNG